MYAETSGWKVASRSAVAHYVDHQPGHLRVVYAALCGRKSSTWRPRDDPRISTCFECADELRKHRRAWTP